VQTHSVSWVSRGSTASECNTDIRFTTQNCGLRFVRSDVSRSRLITRSAESAATLNPHPALRATFSRREKEHLARSIFQRAVQAELRGDPEP
jgi:hypothetical protein